MITSRGVVAPPGGAPDAGILAVKATTNRLDVASAVSDVLTAGFWILALAAGVYAEDVLLALAYFSAGSMVVSGWQLIWFYRLARKADRRKKREP